MALVPAVLLTLLGSSGTLLGAMLVVVSPRPDASRLGVLQGLSAGLMLAVSFFDLLPAAIEAVGSRIAILAFFGGAAFFAAVSAVFEDAGGDALAASLIASGEKEDVKRRKKNDDDDAGAGDGRAKTKTKTKTDEAVDVEEKGNQRRRAMLSGLLTALGIALHNFPEGIAVYLASLKEAKLGLSVGIAIAMHNIPEGLCIALPVYFATGSKWEGVRLAALSGIAEPTGAILVGILLPRLASETMVESMLAAVAGIMTFLSFAELLPLSYATASKWHVISAVFAGMALMAATLMMMEATGAE